MLHEAVEATSGGEGGGCRVAHDLVVQGVVLVAGTRVLTQIS